MKISVEAARLACPESKDETHFLLLPLFVPIAEFDPADQSVGYGMSVRTEMLRDGKTRRTLANASEMFTKTFPQSAPSLADVNGRAAFYMQPFYMLPGPPLFYQCFIKGACVLFLSF